MARKFTQTAVRKIVEEGTGSEYTFVSLDANAKKDPVTGKRSKRKLTVKHNECGHTYTIPLYEFTDGKRRCAKCKGKRLNEHFAQSIQSVRKETEEMTDGEYSFVDIMYKNAKTKHLFRHNTCGKVFPKKWEKFKGTPKQLGQRCPNCQRNGMESMASRYVRDILDHFNVTYDTEKRFLDCINPETGMVLPFDYYLPKIHLLIEVDGEQHERACFTPWDVEGTRKRDKIKNEYAEKNGIALVRIPAKEWPALPRFLFDILSEKLVKNLTLENVESVIQTSHPERISADLIKVHNGEYTLYDNFYTGSERKHRYQHIKCGHIFMTTLAYLKDNKHPCPKCREKKISQDKYKKSNRLLLEKSDGNYSLSQKALLPDAKGRRLIHCHACGHEWPCIVGNIMKNKAGCPACFERRKDRHWQMKMEDILRTFHKGNTLTKKQKQWLWHNKQRLAQGKLKGRRQKMFREVQLNLV